MAEAKEKKRREIRLEKTGDNGLPRDVNYVESAVTPPHRTCVYLENNKFIKEETVTPTEGPSAEFSIEPEPLVAKVETEMYEKNDLNELVDLVMSETSYINLEYELTIEEIKVNEALNAQLINTDPIKGETLLEPSYANLEDDKLTIEEYNVKTEAPNAELDITDSEPVGIENKPECDIKGKRTRPRKTAYCELCDKHFFHTSYKRHQLVHSDKKPFSCNICSEAFKQKSYLVSHIKSHSDDRPFSCDICSTKFKWKYNLASHMKTHSDDRPFSCHICSTKFKWKYNLATHMKTHSNTRHLDSHMKTHSDDKPFTCDICNVKFIKKSNLASHMKTHSDDRPFSCHICSTKFKWKNNLASHMKCHSDTRQFSCDTCNVKFKWKYNLATHMKCHSDTRQFSCDTCNAKFKCKYNLDSHMKTHDDRPFTCNICNSKYKTKRSLATHMKYHT